MGILDWLLGTNRTAERLDSRPPEAPAAETPQTVPPGWACSRCGRSDLPPTGDWDPPICLECDAVINFEADLHYQEFLDDDR
jgi:hypothetical protein